MAMTLDLSCVTPVTLDSPPLFTGLLPKISEVGPLQEHVGQSYRPSGDKKMVPFNTSRLVNFLSYRLLTSAEWSLDLWVIFSLSVFPFMRRQRHASPSPAQATAHPAEEDGHAKGAKKAGTNSSVHSNAWCPDQLSRTHLVKVFPFHNLSAFPSEPQRSAASQL